MQKQIEYLAKEANIAAAGGRPGAPLDYQSVIPERNRNKRTVGFFHNLRNKVSLMRMVESRHFRNLELVSKLV